MLQHINQNIKKYSGVSLIYFLPSCTTVVLDADWNAAINIANRYRPGTFTVPICGKLNLLGRSSSTGQSRKLTGNRGSLKPTVL